jgi:hypothetical protein
LNAASRSGWRCSASISEFIGLARTGFLAQRVLPRGEPAQFVDQHGDRDGAGVVRGHHQEDHVVDDVGVGELRAVLTTATAQHGEQVGAVAGAAARHLLAK